jgi:hypothetical protein
MAFNLTFGPEFFLAEGEPYDRDDRAVNDDGLPTSVWSAIDHWKEHNPEQWVCMAKKCFDLNKRDSEILMGEAVLELIQQTNTCSDIRTPVEVWIDEDGDFKLKVY